MFVKKHIISLNIISFKNHSSKMIFFFTDKNLSEYVRGKSYLHKEY